MSISSQDFRSAMSLYPTGVAVVTTECEGSPPFGMTINSFTSLSLSPPLVMWNLQKSSDTYTAWHDTDVFAVNFLRADQNEISSQYARKGEHQLPAEAMKRGVTGCPLLVECMASLECRTHARYEEGDHVIIIGEVVNVVSSNDESPLVFHRGKYTTVNVG
jgi:flavin reductase (DIM6/NTAB) family NADH-FMN oxidoreductase RutF